ncbi:hypothetical protein F383_30619 [Gossypium arboreum]|uniref:Uncharacterized protein n=1 Tax=Gossypium arboreum TaxID=29729 RepID=A0A0B0MWC6_GOSAR|nr:hypothetical protein F383_30619 [Gossypium arboreum]
MVMLHNCVSPGVEIELNSVCSTRFTHGRVIGHVT